MNKEVLFAIFLTFGFSVQAQVGEEEFKKCIDAKPPSVAKPGEKEGIKVQYQKATASDFLSSPAEGDLQAFKQALERQIKRCASPTKTTVTFEFGCRIANRNEYCLETNRQLLDLVRTAKSFPDLMEKAKRHFDWYKISDAKKDPNSDKGDFIFTAYNNPVLEISKEKQGEYIYPIYALPKEESLRRLTREEIDLQNKLVGKGLEIGYAKSRLDILSLQVEGSGMMKMKQPDGSIKEVQFNYAGQNGQRNVMLAKILRCKGVPSDQYSSNTKAEEYFKKNPEMMELAIKVNPSYVFFKPVNHGPQGHEGVELTPRHSVATDRKVIPSGSVVLFSTQRPDEGGPKNFSNISIAQDIGGAIRGLHVDTYWGQGAYADKASSEMKGYGPLFIALPKEKPLTGKQAAERAACEKQAAAEKLPPSPTPVKKTATGVR